MTRKHISLRTKLAAALCALKDARGDYLIPWEHTKLIPEGALIAMFDFDHYPIRHEHDGPAAHWNLVPRLKPEHRQKTAKIDIPQGRKGDRIAAAHEAFRRKMLSKTKEEGGAEPDKKPAKKAAKIRSRALAGTVRSGLRKRMSGKVERR